MLARVGVGSGDKDVERKDRFAGKPRSNGITRNLPEQRMFCAPSPDGLPDISVSLE